MTQMGACVQCSFRPGGKEEGTCNRDWQCALSALQQRVLVLTRLDPEFREVSVAPEHMPYEELVAAILGALSGAAAGDAGREPTE